MLALVLENGQLVLRSDQQLPIPGPGEALLRVRLAGICGTDMALIHGYKGGGYSGVLGHEYVAEVIEAPGRKNLVGQRVVGEINTTCGQCERCHRGLITHCLHRSVLGILNWDGAFAEYFVSPLDLLHRVPEGLSDDMVVFAEPVAAAYAVLRDLPADAGRRVIIFGDGRLGQLIAAIFVVEGYDPLLLGRHPAKLEVANRLGVRTTLSVPDDTEFDVAVDATGSPEALSRILDCLRPRGTVVLKTTTADPGILDLSHIVVNELRVIGSRCGPFPRALTALSSGQLDPRPLISARYPLTRALEAFEYATQPGVLKVLLSP